jgi:membrane protein
MSQFFKIFVTGAKSWSADNAFKHSAAVSFYTLFSLAPITLIAISVAGFFFGKDAATQQFTSQMTQLVGQNGAEVIQKAMASNEVKDGNGWGTVIGIALLIVGATTVFGQLQDSLNDIWGVTSKPSRSGWLVIIVQRLISFSMVLTVGFLLLSSLVLTTALTSLLKHTTGSFADSEGLIRSVDMLVGFVVVSALFAVFYKVLPDVKLRWREVWTGAILTSVLFTIGRFLIAIYLTHSGVASTYGAAGSLVALLMWIYYSSAIMFFGAEYIRADRSAHGLDVEPKPTAVRVRREIIEAPSPQSSKAGS